MCTYLSSLQLKTAKSTPRVEQAEFPAYGRKQDWTPQESSGQLRGGVTAVTEIGLRVGSFREVLRKQGLILHWEKDSSVTQCPTKCTVRAGQAEERARAGEEAAVTEGAFWVTRSAPSGFI